MTIEEQLKETIIKKSGSVNKFAQTIGLPTSTVATIFSRGVNNTNVNTIIKICQALGISADELADGKITYLTDIDRPNIQIEKLTDDNKARLIAYYQALLDTQEGKL